MAPSKKSKTVGKRAAHEVSPSKDVKILKKSRKKKTKMVDVLGPQWSKQELERFYQGYRKYGSDWKKVATIVRNRSPEMVEAVYNMNRAYLSLPEGTASVVGLIAMMTDHYNNLEGNGSEGDDDYPRISKRAQKYKKGSFHGAFPQQQLLQRQSPKEAEGCLALLKKCYDGWQLHVPVKKRTPRVPITALEKTDSETLQQVGSSQVSPTTNGTMEDYNNLTQVSLGKQVGKHHGIKMNDRSIEDHFAGRGDKNVDLRVKLPHVGYKKEKKGKKQKDGFYKNFHDAPEAYSDFSRRLNVDPLVGRLNLEARAESPSHQAQRKRSKKLCTEDESLACDALNALADLSLALTLSAAEPVESSRESANGGEITVDSTAASDATVVKISTGEGSKKKKHKTLKIQTAEKQSGLQSRRPVEEKAPLAEEDMKSGNMFKEHNQACADIKHSKSARSSVVTSIIDQEMADVDVVVSSRQHLATDQVALPFKRKIQRKQERPLITNGIKDSAHSSRDVLKKHSSLLPGTVPYLKDKLSCCLASPLLRRWCGFEWFYSAIDYPWFAKQEFFEYINHVGLGHLTMLTRVEWGVIRSSLGKPRRFSRHFLQEETEKLERYRESVRTHYSELRAGLREGLPTDLARPLSVGQRVIAIHPKTREFHDGSILTVDRDKFRVQFDRPELGVEFVMDINCMPCNQLENMPEVIRRRRFSIDYANSNGQITDGQSMLAFSSMNAWSGTSTLSNGAINQAKVDLTSISAHSKEVENQPFRIPSTMHVEASAFHVQPREGDCKRSVHLNNSMAGEVLPYLFHPKQGRSYPGSFINGSQSNADTTIAGEVPRYTGDSEDSASKVADIVRGSREKAHIMVDAAIQAILGLEEGENAYARIGEALESMSKIQHPSESGSLNDQNESKVSISANSAVNDAKDLKFPRELIRACVSTLLMIQKCTDRQYAPAEVAHVLDKAVMSMQPCCPQNLTVYREIEMCMGRIKTQILALIPS